MKPLRKSSLTLLVAMLFVIVTGEKVIAGGLVDTGVERFIAASFKNSADITSPWWTLPAGHNFLYFAQDGEDCSWNLTEVMKAKTNNFGGIYSRANARIILDRGWVDQGCRYGTDLSAFHDVWNDPATFEEATYDWYAQDTDKNIWYMGEDTFDGVGKAGSFVAGCDGAEPGIVLLGNPSKGAYYRQEFYEDQAEDWGKVVNLQKQDGRVLLTTKEWSPLESGAIEHKLYYTDGKVGELSLIEELNGKTVIEQLVGRDVEAPPTKGIPGSINPIPSSCPAP